MRLAIILLGIGCGVTAARAAETAGGSLPYETWLQTLQTSFTGPVAFSVALLGIISSGATLIFAGNEIGRFVRTILYLVLVMTLLVGSNSLMTKFFNGATIGGEIRASELSLPDGCRPGAPDVRALISSISSERAVA